jgi:hypothetical protein
MTVKLAARIARAITQLDLDVTGDEFDEVLIRVAQAMSEEQPLTPDQFEALADYLERRRRRQQEMLVAAGVI